MGCTSLLYYPNSYRYVDERTLDRPPTEVELKAAGQSDLLSWYFEADHRSRRPITIVFVHGNGQNMSAHFRSMYWTLSEGLNFLIVGYPGYGPNTGKPTPDSTVETVRAALQWVQKNRPNDAVFLFGQSLGGNVALRALSESPDVKLCGVGIEASFLSYKKIAQKTMSRSWLLWLFQWLPYIAVDDSRSIAANVMNLPQNTPYLVIHGDHDQSVPLEMGQKLFEKLPFPKEFWTIEGGKHIDTFMVHTEQRKRFADFVIKNCEAKAL